jgi:plastocyanin
MTTKRVIALAAGVAAWACNGNTTQPHGPPTEFVKSGGDAQTWYFNNPLPTPLSVTARDGSGRPVPGVLVTWVATSGGVSPAQSTTNANGVASTIDSLGSATTFQTVSASITALPNAVAFTEIGSAPPTSAAVDVRNDNFNPASVVIQTGGTVTWTETGTGHNVTFTGGPTPLPAKIFEADLATGTADSRTRTLTAVGTYSYSCTNHPPNMNGTVRVVH